MPKGFLALVFLAALGCASGPIGSLPPMDVGVPTGEIIVIRNKNFLGSGNSYKIVVDDEPIFAIRVGQYTSFRLTEGVHDIGVMCHGGWTPTWKTDEQTVILGADERIHFIVSPNAVCADIKRVDAAEASTYLRSFEYVEMPQ
jgi:hypothetical protein